MPYGWAILTSQTAVQRVWMDSGTPAGQVGVSQVCALHRLRIVSVEICRIEIVFFVVLDREESVVVEQCHCRIAVTRVRAGRERCLHSLTVKLESFTDSRWTQTDAVVRIVRFYEIANDSI